jgi:Ras-related protein Rab-1A
MKNTGSVDINYDYKCQIIVIGDSTVGKTSLLFQYNNQLNPLKQVATVGIDYFTKDVVIEKKVIRTKIWDTAGQERFRSITDNFFKCANGVILVFDLNNRESYDNLKIWVQSIRLKVVNKNIRQILIGNKLDLKREISYEEGLEFANDYGLVYFETSVKTKTNIHESIDYLIAEIYKTGDLERTKNTTRSEVVDIKVNKNGKSENKTKTEKSCC